MLFNTVVSGLAVASMAAAATVHKVEVGNGALKFNPNRTVAAVGDIIEFTYFPKNHSVAQSLFTNPCQSTEGFFSGFVPVASGTGDKTFRLVVNDTKPIWFYCTQPGAGGHCAQGMVGCVNCPTSGNTIDAFALLAKKTNGTAPKQPASVNGGTFAAAGQGYGSGTTTAAAGASATSNLSTSSTSTWTATSTYVSAGQTLTTSYLTTGVPPPATSTWTASSTYVSAGSTYTTSYLTTGIPPPATSTWTASSTYVSAGSTYTTSYLTTGVPASATDSGSSGSGSSDSGSSGSGSSTTSSGPARSTGGAGALEVSKFALLGLGAAALLV